MLGYYCAEANQQNVIKTYLPSGAGSTSQPASWDSYQQVCWPLQRQGVCLSFLSTPANRMCGSSNPCWLQSLVSADQVEGIEHSANMERQGDNIQISFSPVAPDSIRVGSEWVESATPDIDPPTSNEKPSFGPRPDVKSANFDF